MSPKPHELQTDLIRHMELKRKALEAAARGNEFFQAGKTREAQAAWAEHDEHEELAGLIARKWRR